MTQDNAQDSVESVAAAEPVRGCLTLRRRALEDTDDRELIEVVRGGDAEAPGQARGILTERYQPLVIGQSAKMHPGRGPDHGDVVSVAQHGLQRAIRDYDLDHGAHFAAYARAKVRGEVMRWFRDDRYSVNVPRLHGRFMQVRRAAAQLEPVLHREPDVEEVAAHLDCSVAEIIEAWAVESAHRVHTRELDERDRLLLYRRFWEGVSQHVVGKEIGVSQTHVSRREQRALNRLKDRPVP